MSAQTEPISTTAARVDGTGLGRGHVRASRLRERGTGGACSPIVQTVLEL